MWKRRPETGTGFAHAKLSEILPSARVARFVRMTDTARVARCDRMGKTVYHCHVLPHEDSAMIKNFLIS